MEKQKAMELITNSFNTVGKIREYQLSRETRDTDGNSKKMDLESLIVILQAISEYSPEKYRTTLTQAADMSKKYIYTFNNLRKHIGSLEKPRMRSSNIVNTLGVIKPALRENEAKLADKLIKIYELLNDWS